MSLIPVTIITGFLGAGKTTLLNRILRDKQHKQRIAVIENEFGEENIDSNILVQDDAEQIVEMSNGCICCTIRSDLVTALTRLANKRKAAKSVLTVLLSKRPVWPIRDRSPRLSFWKTPLPKTS